MPDEWETKYLAPKTCCPATISTATASPISPSSRTNTHPLGFFTQYLAEGATGAFFDTQLALFNPGNRTRDRAAAVPASKARRKSPMLISLPPHTRRALNVETEVAGLAEASFSTVAESDAQIVVDRTMTWDANGFGSHAETAAAELSRNWYLAEGATHGTFDLYYLLQNPHPTRQANVTITYLRPERPAPITMPYTVRRADA